MDNVIVKGFLIAAGVALAVVVVVWVSNNIEDILSGISFDF